MRVGPRTGAIELRSVIRWASYKRETYKCAMTVCQRHPSGLAKKPSSRDLMGHATLEIVQQNIWVEPQHPSGGRHVQHPSPVATTYRHPPPLGHWCRRPRFCRRHARGAGLWKAGEASDRACSLAPASTRVCTAHAPTASRHRCAPPRSGPQYYPPAGRQRLDRHRLALCSNSATAVRGTCARGEQPRSRGPLLSV